MSRVVLCELADLVIGLANEVGRQDKTAATESRQDLIFDGTVNRTEVLDLSLTLLRVAIHSEDAKNEVFILHVAVLHCFLEAFPVLSGDVRLDSSIHFVLLQTLLEEVLSYFLTVLSQFLVQSYATIRRSITGNFEVCDLFAVSLVSVLDSILEGFHLSGFGLRAAEVSALDEELDVRLGELLDHALEPIRGSSGSVVARCSESSGRNDTVSNLQVRNLDLFLTYGSFEAEVQLRFSHLRNIVEGASLAVTATLAVVNGRTVLFGFLAYISNGFANSLLALVLQHRSNGENTLLGEFLLRESTGNGSLYLTAFQYQRVRVYLNLLRVLQRLVARCQHHYSSDEAKE